MGYRLRLWLRLGLGQGLGLGLELDIPHLLPQYNPRNAGKPQRPNLLQY